MMSGKFSKGLSARFAVAKQQADGGGFGNKDIFNYPSQPAFFTPKEGQNAISILPYAISSQNHPLIANHASGINIGDTDYCINLFVHRFIGPAQGNCVCLRQFGRACPICEQQNLLKQQGKQKESDSLKASQRVFYNVEDANEPGKVKIFEASNYLFEHELIDEAKAGESTGGAFVNFVETSPQKRVMFRGEKCSQGGYEFLKFKGFSFQDLNHDTPESLLSQVIPLDKYLKVPTYQQAEQMLMGTPENAEEQSSEAKVSTLAQPVVSTTTISQPVISTRTLAQPQMTTGTSFADMPPVADKAEGSCPSGYAFGADCDAKPECASCPKWEACLNVKAK